MSPAATDKDTPAPGMAAPRPSAPAAFPVRRLVLGNAFVILLVIALTALMLFQNLAEHHRQAEAASLNLARLQAHGIAAVIDKTDVSLQTVALAAERQMARGGIDPRAMGELLAQQQLLLPELASLRLADAAGRIDFAGPDGDPAPVQVDDRDYFRHARENPAGELFISKPVLGRINHKWTVFLTRRIDRPDGSFGGVVLAGIQADYFRSLFALNDLGSQGALALRTADLHLIVRYPANPAIEAPAGRGSVSSRLQQAVAANPVQGTYVFHHPAEGIERMTSYAKVGNYPLYVVAGLATADYLAGWRQDALQVAGLALVIILVTAGSSWLVYLGWRRQHGATVALARESYRNQLLLDTTGDGIHIIDSQGRLVECNAAFCAQLGYGREELAGMDIAGIDAALAPEDLAASLRGGGQRAFETRHRRRDGGLIDVEVRAVEAEMDGERLIFAAARDVTGRKLAEAEQRRLTRTLELLNDSNTALLHADQEDRLLPDICRLIVEKGGYLMAWVGFPEHDPDRTVRPAAACGDSQGYLDGIRVSWGDNPFGQGPTGLALRSGATQINQNILLNPGMAPWREAAMKVGYKASIALPMAGSGTVFGVLTIYARELEAFGAEEVRLLEKLASNLAFGIEGLRAKVRLASLNRELQAFTYAASHDMKGPLGRINSFSTLLERNYRDRLAGDGLLFLDLIRRNATRLTALVEDLLAFAQIEQRTLNLQSVDLRGAVQAVLQEKEEDFAERQAEIRVDLPALAVRANPHGLAQVLRNLLENALKYSSRTRLPVIDIGGVQEGGLCRLWIRDNGIGFDMAYGDRIFEIFRRLHTYEEFPGSGVGLALVRKAMERMGGRVWADSRPEQGATFYLELEAEALAPAGAPASAAAEG